MIEENKWYDYIIYTGYMSGILVASGGLAYPVVIFISLLHIFINRLIKFSNKKELEKETR